MVDVVEKTKKSINSVDVSCFFFPITLVVLVMIKYKQHKDKRNSFAQFGLSVVSLSFTLGLQLEY